VCACGQGCVGSCGSSAGPYTPVSEVNLQDTVVDRLIPTIDGVRNLKTKFGLRAYEVRIIRVKWTGGARSQGVEAVTSSLVILPTPKVVDISALDQTIQPIGLDEFGLARVTEISGRYTEDQLRGLGPNGEPIPPGENVFWEVQYPELRNRPQIRRRFTIETAPEYLPAKVQWVITLRRQREDRTRTGRIAPP